MDQTGRVLLLLVLSASVFFIIAGAKDFSKYDKFEGLANSVEKDLGRQISETRWISKRAVREKKHRDNSDMTVHELTGLLQRLEAGQFSYGSPFRIAGDVPVVELMRILRLLDAGKVSLKPTRSPTAVHGTVAPPVTEKTAKSRGKPADLEKEPTIVKYLAIPDSMKGIFGEHIMEQADSPVTEETAKSGVKSAGSTTELSMAKSRGSVDSTKGVPGEHFPDYTDIPETDFTCSDKPTVPGFYADLDTNCQVFHVCWPDRRETFLCPVGTTFNQAILACDYWYSNNCSLAPQYYSVNMGDTGLDTSEEGKQESVSSMINALLESSAGEPSKEKASKTTPRIAGSVLSFVSKLLPIKAKVVVYPEPEEQSSQTPEYASDIDSGDGSTETAAKDSEPEISTDAEMPDVIPDIIEDTVEEIFAEDPETSSQPEISVDAEIPPKAAAEERPLSDSRIRPLWSLEYRMDQALVEAYKELNDYFAPLLQTDPPDTDMVRYKEAYTNVIFQMRHLLRLFSPVDQFVPGTEMWPEKDAFFRSKARAFKDWLVTIMKSAISKLLLEKWSRRPVSYQHPIVAPPQQPKKIVLKPLSKENFKAIWQLYKIALKNVQGELPKQTEIESPVSKATKKAIIKNYLEFFKMNTKTFVYYVKK